MTTCLVIKDGVRGHLRYGYGSNLQPDNLFPQPRTAAEPLQQPHRLLRVFATLREAIFLFSSIQNSSHPILAITIKNPHNYLTINDMRKTDIKWVMSMQFSLYP